MKAMVKLFGRSPRQVQARRGVGVMMQEAAQAPELKVRELIEQVSGYYPAPRGVEATDRARGRAGDRRPALRQAVGWAEASGPVCARNLRPPVALFLDEPSANLDASARHSLWAAVRKLVAEGTAIVLTTHYIEEAEALADRVAVLGQGRCIASGTVAEMRAVVQGKRIDCGCRLPIADVLGWAEVDEAVIEGDTMSVFTNDVETVLRRLLAADAGLSRVEVSRTSLSEAIASVTQERVQ